MVRILVPNDVEQIMVRFMHPFDDLKNLLIFLAFSIVVVQIFVLQLLTHD